MKKVKNKVKAGVKKVKSEYKEATSDLRGSLGLPEKSPFADVAKNKKKLDYELNRYKTK